MTEHPDRDAHPSEAAAGVSPAGRDLDALLADDAVVDAAIAAAHRDVVRIHRLLGRPLIVWRDGRVVEEMAEPEAEASGAPTPPAPEPSDHPPP